jgi:hypothetical protein
LNAKKHALSQAVLSDLGVENNLVILIWGLKVYCQQEKLDGNGEVKKKKLLTTNFVYPDGWVGNGKELLLLSF